MSLFEHVGWCRHANAPLSTAIRCVDRDHCDDYDIPPLGTQQSTHSLAKRSPPPTNIPTGSKAPATKSKPGQTSSGHGKFHNPASSSSGHDTSQPNVSPGLSRGNAEKGCIIGHI
ncbi:hypothetical protein BD309DRAFT_630670 [Dichomitus squalens]|nr:hypothetical protein BD309DRAFT_630670 [Dichomitus squalens]